MTPLRPEPEAGQEGPYAQGADGADGAFEAAVEQLADPLNDPLPGQHASPWFRADNMPADQQGPPDHQTPQAPQRQETQQAHHGPQGGQEAPTEWYDPEGYQRDWYGQQEPSAPAPVPVPAPASAPAPAPAPAPEPVLPPADDATVGLRTADTRRMIVVDRDGREPRLGQEPRRTPGQESGQDPEPTSVPLSSEPRTGGRAERRKAAKGRGRRRPGPRPDAEADSAGAADPAVPAVPMTRLEARRAARAAKDSPAVVASRVVGEVFISLGVLMLLFVTYQLWWTNIRADQIAGKETNKIQDDWANGERNPGVFEPGHGFAIMYIPKLDVVAPIAEGISKEKVLDRGMIGHYGEGKLKTAMPSDEQGNFSVAGHRNTHGEPFRYINKLSPGDPIVVETQDAYYTYEMTSVLPQTSPSNVSVIGPVPPGSGFKGPGRYITLTTCTPEFTSTYRLIVWGKMVDERPRSKGKPDALVG
ncbi:class E sortase [Streptomyces sp. NBC_01433]|uniref:class E sortase n=1 Tax=Streptomyces sp. NBC_01433 TaxID=2903864 RepID=UPI00224F50CD|nr:class E sortase [Streptomyces sp. NBC_01433]MCX4675830.1 class E sortase [Streptomyces sp. NBC_01433]